MSTTYAQAPQLPPNVTAYLQSGRFGEDGMLENTGGNVGEFTNYVKANWAQLLDNFNVVAPSHREKLLIIAACEALSPTDYLAVLEKLSQLSQAPGFDVKNWNAVLVTTKLKQGFLAYNYQNVRVRAVIDRILEMIPADDPQRPEIQKILSGHARQHFMEINAAYDNGDVTHVALP